MNKKTKLKIILYINIIILVFLIFYKGYLIICESDFEAQNIESINEIQKTDSEEISFAVFGNIKSSISIFDKDIIKSVNKDKNINFAISNGDSILDGYEDKYRILNKSVKKINVPVIVAVGDKEITNDGDQRFYKHYGPYYFSFDIKDSYFIFLDTSGKTSEKWQKYWLVEELKKSKNYNNTFVFMNKSIVEFDFETIFDDEKNYVLDSGYKTFLQNTFTKYDVTTVFASIAGMHGKKTIDGVDYIISGASGGTLITDDSDSFYHYVKVTVKDNGVSYEIIEQGDMNQRMIVRLIENIWIYIHSVFYINYLNFIILLGVIILLIVILYKKASENVDYYRDFAVDQKISTDRQLNILMVTNNYLPFIGGVPVSINRALRGLKAQGNNVTVFAPEYPDLKSSDENVVRFKLLKYYGDNKFKFPIVNIFSRKFDKEFKKLDIDVIHVHQPFWMGSRGLRLGIKYNKPVVLTYHTRLEEYSHFLPAFQLVFKNIVSHKLIKRFSQKCDAIISPTYTAKEYLRNVGVSRPKFVIPTGVDLDQYVIDEKVDKIKEKYAPNGEKLLCTVSRLSTEKNIYFILKGMKYIKEHTEIPFKLLMIGDGNEKEDIEKYIGEHKLENYVKLTDKVPPETVTKYYLASDLFVFSSLSETQGMVILEAMAGGCPVVAVRASGIDDIVENRYNGFKTKNNVKEWSEKVIQLLESKELYQEMKSNALEYSKDYSIVEIGKKIEEAYYYVIGNRKK